jgi:Leucine-rich repeat (LRR) protein
MKISFDPLAGLGNLKTLQLSINQLTTFTDKTFIWLENLEILNLASNSIIEITEKTFEGLKNVRDVNLFSNDISKLHPQSFATMTNLRTLDLGENELENIPSKLLITNDKLERLVLMYNKIKSIDYHLFDNSLSLTTIWMGGNECTDSNMLMGDDLASFKRSTVQCLTNSQRAIADNLQLILPIQLERDFNELKKSWMNLSEFSEAIHDVSRQHVNLITDKLNNLTSSLQFAGDMLEKSQETVDNLRSRMSSVDYDGKYFNVKRFVDGKFITLLALQITCLILLIVIISSIIYVMWKIKLKENSLQI